MIKEQIEARGISSQSVLNAMRSVERKYFIHPELRNQAYNDAPLSIGHGQTMSQPYIVAYMLEKLNIQPSDKVLEIGTGSGYQTALLSIIAKEVYSVEAIKPLLIQAQERLKKHKNVHIKLSGNELGWKENKLYDKIIVSAAAEQLPMILVDQLKPNGSMIIPVGSRNQELLLIHRNLNDIRFEKLIPVVFLPLV
ncbi:MAG: protein-L-isoaspartate O-methyltransferase [Candidatus Margulisbacteria bacterium GWF2_38_17]|nr:MAG: protein-L-isoaspartate O-methyltransferase [Candidatus Margulisbacteria bacterium GWD2_39_127]OGI04796.1 MAG: protein-L-isoaspartate O-methyltransferase [Candidatus Margulisbacteria bacterium GWF2_38_17]OGI05741.1 MAG: protein-L-isoaspartate O-methyltransferase [Candidatus Margulisbacteria bacterium GWE2_39_32]